MSHFAVTVAAGAERANAAEEAVHTLLAEFEVHRSLPQECYEQTAECCGTNPQAAWDCYQFGGRFSDKLPIHTEADPTDLLEWEHGWTKTTTYAGRKRALDFEHKRTAAAQQGSHDWDTYARVVAGTPQHQPWSEFVVRVEHVEAAAPTSWQQLRQEALKRVHVELGLTDKQVAEALTPGSPEYRCYLDRCRTELDTARQTFQASLDYPLAQARADYAAQPRIAAIRTHYQGSGPYRPEETFDHLSRQAYVQRRRLQAIPGWATLTHDGRWLTPGCVGWCGLATDTGPSQANYLAEANAYLDALAEDMWLLVVDCHI